MVSLLRLNSWFAWLIVVLLLVLNGAIAYAILRPEPTVLTVSFLDVGQGDGILIEGPTGIDVLIDGGKDRSVLRRLPQEIGFLDRTIDLLIATHPDADHIGGLPEVLARYQVGALMESGVAHETSQTKRLEAYAENEEGIVRVLARRGMRIHLGGGAYADVLYPDQDVRNAETNTGSIALHVVYGDTSFMFTGDLPSSVEDHLVVLDPNSLKSDVLKAGHHGSRTSTDELWLAAVDPRIVVISAGKDNSYGHPHEETLDRVQESGAEIVSTAEEGTITFVSDGVSIRGE